MKANCMSPARSSRLRVRRGDLERGAAAVWIVFLAGAMLAVAGLVIDGGYAMGAKREAARAAEQSARAAADQLDTDSIRTGGDDLNVAAAAAAARAYLSAAGESGTVRINGADVTVTVTKSHQSVILSAFGKSSFTMSSSASATSIDGPQ